MSHDPVAVISDSPLFRADWYLHTYPDVRDSGIDPVRHYLNYGAQIGRDPGPDFSTAGYLRRHADVAEAGHNPLWHFELFGRAEGRAIFPGRHGSLPSADEDVIASEIARDRATVPPAEAEALVAKTLSRRAEGPLLRWLADFDQPQSRRFIDALVSRPECEVAARRRKASVIMPTHNRAGQVQAALRSVLWQSHRNLELIVVDDGSTDDTARVVNRHADDPRLKFLRIPHSGVAAARNIGLRQAQGDVIFYLDSDNIWTLDFLRLMLIALEVSQAGCGYAALRLQDAEGQTQGYRGEPFDWKACFDLNYVDLNVFCHRRGLVSELGDFDSMLRRMVDWDLILRYTRHDAPVFCPFIGCLYSDIRDDLTRVSTSQPYAFHRLVQRKLANGDTDAATTLQDLRFSIGLKIGAAPDSAAMSAAATLAATLADRGHEVQVDDEAHWYARHPHQDDLVVILCDPSAYVRHPEQINMVLCGPGYAGGPPDRQDAVHIDTEALDPAAIALRIEREGKSLLAAGPS